MTGGVTGIILAAGRSRRLGRPKALLAIDGVPLLTRMVRTVRAAGLRPLVAFGEIVWGPEADGADWITVPSSQDTGMGATIAAAIASLRDTARCLITPVDLPTLTADHLRALVAVPTPVGASVLPDGNLGAPASFAARCFDRLAQLRADRGARALLRSGLWPVTAVTPPAALIDIDTEADWLAFQHTLEVPCG